MSYITKAASLLTAAGVALCLSSAAMAQDRPTPPPGADMAARHADHEARMKAHKEQRAHRLHDILNIRADQESAFQAFLADMQPPHHEHKDWAAEHRDAASATPLTTPERLDRMAAMMAKRTAEHQARFQHRADAVKRFYAVLSPEQKRAFDALHDRGGMGHGRGGMDGREGGRGEHPGWGGQGRGEEGEAG
jgi:protein CpxP